MRYRPRAESQRKWAGIWKGGNLLLSAPPYATRSCSQSECSTITSWRALDKELCGVWFCACPRDTWKTGIMKKSGKITWSHLRWLDTRCYLWAENLYSDSHEKICFLHLADCRELKIQFKVNSLGFDLVVWHFQVPRVCSLPRVDSAI